MNLKKVTMTDLNFIEEECLNCGICHSIAPDFFSRTEKSGYHYVVRQPQRADELELVNEAMDSCPVEAIIRKKLME